MSTYTPPTKESVAFPKLMATLPSASGKVVVITGTTTGTGFHAASACAIKGARVVLLNRSSDRATASLEKLKKAHPKTEFTQVACDLQNFDSVRAAAAAVDKQFATEGVDVLINNAGIMAMPDKRTADGYDIQMQTNHLSHFLLTKELYPALQRAAARTGEARVVNHSSKAAHGPPLEEKYLKKSEEGGLGGLGTAETPWGTPQFIRYHQTKLANQVFTHAFNNRAPKDCKVRAFAAHPGLAATALTVTTTQGGGWDHDQAAGFMKNSQSAEDGACGILTAGLGADLKGSYYGPKTMVGDAISLDLDPVFDTKEAQEILWPASVEAVGGDIF
jgi:NAD(P)-dependent dehydrogenase (short-subunit alcohol dehydrogenase family)